MEDGLLVSHHLAIPHRQGVIAPLQVKILKCQLDHLDNSGDIAKTTVNDRCLNAPDTSCRGVNPFHLWLSISLSIHPSSFNLFCICVWHNYIHMNVTAVYNTFKTSILYCKRFILFLIYSNKSQTDTWFLGLMPDMSWWQDNLQSNNTSCGPNSHKCSKVVNFSSYLVSLNNPDYPFLYYVP